jgi:hypothetical protein
VATVNSVRRYYLHKRLEARLYQGEDDSELVWAGKQEAEPGTALAEGFPLRAELTELGYSTVQDLDGADEDELVRAGLTAKQARQVLAAFAAL